MEQIVGPGDARRGMLLSAEFEAFFVSEQKGALRLAWLLTHDRGRADDLVQDAFASVMVRFDELEYPAAYFGQTSSIDNNFATDDLFTWSNLPADVASVGYDDGVVQLWRRPVAGVAIFRVDPNHPHPSITAFDATGTALQYSFWDQNSPITSTSDTTVHIVSETPAIPQAGPDMWGELRTLTQSAIYDCLTANGASWPVSNVPSFNADVDPLAIWNSCVVEVKSIVAARVTELTKGK